MNLKMRLLIVNMLRILRFRGSKREIWFRRILTLSLSLGRGDHIFRPRWLRARQASSKTLTFH